jgi:hypothetical protein
MKILSKEDFNDFVNALIKDESWDIIGVKAKSNKFSFEPLEAASELRLDYDVTLLPPKKYFFPKENPFHIQLIRRFLSKEPCGSKDNSHYRCSPL